MALPLALSSPARPLRDLWALGLHLAARSMVPTLAIVSTIALGVFLLIKVSAGLLIVVPGLVAVIWSVAALTAQQRSGLDLSPSSIKEL
jgi:hypothetical protein